MRTYLTQDEFEKFYHHGKIKKEPILSETPCRYSYLDNSKKRIYLKYAEVTGDRYCAYSVIPSSNFVFLLEFDITQAEIDFLNEFILC